MFTACPGSAERGAARGRGGGWRGAGPTVPSVPRACWGWAVPRPRAGRSQDRAAACQAGGESCRYGAVICLCQETCLWCLSGENKQFILIRRAFVAGPLLQYRLRVLPRRGDHAVTCHHGKTTHFQTVQKASRLRRSAQCSCAAKCVSWHGQGSLPFPGKVSSLLQTSPREAVPLIILWCLLV